MTVLCPDGNGTDGSTGGWGSLRASLSLAVVDTPGITYIDMDGCHCSGNISSNGVGDRQWMAPLFWGSPSCPWAVKSETVVDGTFLHLFDEDGSPDVEGSGVLATLRPQRGPWPLTWTLQSQFSACLWPQGTLPSTTGDWVGRADAVPVKDWVARVDHRQKTERRDGKQNEKQGIQWEYLGKQALGVSLLQCGWPLLPSSSPWPNQTWSGPEWWKMVPPSHHLPPQEHHLSNKENF